MCLCVYISISLKNNIKVLKKHILVQYVSAFSVLSNSPIISTENKTMQRPNFSPNWLKWVYGYYSSLILVTEQLAFINADLDSLKSNFETFTWKLSETLPAFIDVMCQVRTSNTVWETELSNFRSTKMLKSRRILKINISPSLQRQMSPSLFSIKSLQLKNKSPSETHF